MSNIGIIGAGGWGLALANIFSEKHNINVWVHSEESYILLSSVHRNDNYLKNIELNKSINFTTDIGEAVNDNEIIIIATPSFAHCLYKALYLYRLQQMQKREWLL